MILQDKNGNQIWFPYYYDEKKSIPEDLTIQSILEFCGFETKQLSNFEKIYNWIKLNIFEIPYGSEQYIK